VAYEFTPVLIPFALATVCVFLPWIVIDELSDRGYQISPVRLHDRTGDVGTRRAVADQRDHDDRRAAVA